MTAVEHSFTVFLLLIGAEMVKGLFQHYYLYQRVSLTSQTKAVGLQSLLSSCCIVWNIWASAPQCRRGQAFTVGHLSFEFPAFFLKDGGGVFRCFSRMTRTALLLLGLSSR